MTIRSHLSALLIAVIAPVALLAGLTSYGWVVAQREMHEQRYIERVRALGLALDTELSSELRMLRGLAERESLSASGDAQLPLQRALEHNARWSWLALVDADGTRSAFVADDDAQDARGIELAPVLRDASGDAGAKVSGLVSAPGGRQHYTLFIVPLAREGQAPRLLVLGVGARHWLDFLRGYPLPDDVTLTLSDGAGLIIARTLNHERWVGRSARPDFIAHARASNEGAFSSIGMEGQRFHTAFKRLGSAPWTLGTGVPAEAVVSAPQRQALLVGIGVLLAGLSAAVMARVLGRRITQAFGSLAELLPMSDDERARAVAEPLPIAEADKVRRLLRDTLQAKADALAAAEGARAQAEAANHAKDEFVAMLAHELRNPLSAMSTSVALLESPRSSPQAQMHARQVLRRQVELSTLLVNDLLDTARINAGQVALRLTDVDLPPLVRGVVDGFADTARAARVELSATLEPAVVRGDAARLEQVIGNLLHNAVKFSRHGGHIRVALQAADGEAVLSVDDDGIGIAADQLERVFEAYVQAAPGLDRARGGLGLGLHLVRRLVGMHGGSVTARSRGAGLGARFEVRLPLSAQPPGVAEAAPPARLAPLRVTLVEDNHDVREAVAQLLRSAGHRVAEAASGEAGLALLRAQATDVALVDIGLPGIDGLELARRLRAEPATRGLLLLALTAYGDDRTRALAAEAGFDGLLQKPFDAASFERMVQALGGQRLAAATAPVPGAGAGDDASARQTT